MLPKRHHKRLLHKVLGILPIISWILLSTSLNLELLLSTAYIGLTKPVFTANMAASLFLTSLLFRTEQWISYVDYMCQLVNGYRVRVLSYYNMLLNSRDTWHVKCGTI